MEKTKRTLFSWTWMIFYSMSERQPESICGPVRLSVPIRLKLLFNVVAWRQTATPPLVPIYQLRLFLQNNKTNLWSPSLLQKNSDDLPKGVNLNWCIPKLITKILITVITRWPFWLHVAVLCEELKMITEKPNMRCPYNYGSLLSCPTILTYFPSNSQREGRIW